ncbi:MAG: GreA/GreB family elongation factor [bacterium]|nr:GreA/GreB family elongation factor [bacterium]
MRVPQRKSEAERRSRERRDYVITAEKAARLRRELEDLRTRKLREAADEANRMAEMGDRSENVGYTVAKAELTRIQNRILSLQHRLDHAIIIEDQPMVRGRVSIGSTVTIERDGVPRTYTILGSSETNPGRGRISYSSPLGAALLGRAAGDEVSVTINGTVKHYRIVAVT